MQKGTARGMCSTEKSVLVYMPYRKGKVKRSKREREKERERERELHKE